MASVTKVGALPLVHCRQGSRVRGGVALSLSVVVERCCCALSLSVVVVRNPEQRTFSLLTNIARLDLGPKPNFLHKFWMFWIQPMFTDVMIAEWDRQCNVSL